MNPLQRNAYYPFLVLISLALVLWQYLGMERRLQLTINEQTEVHLNNQLVKQNNGKGLLLKQQDKATLFCSSEALSNSACALSLPLSQALSAIQLDHYQQLHLDIAFSSNLPDTLLLQFYLQLDAKQGYQHLLQQSIVPRQGRANYQLSLARFYSPSWWQLAAAQTISTSPSQVNYFAVVSGDNPQAKNIELSLYSLELSGKLIAAKDLYLGLLTVWLISLSISYAKLNRGLKEQHQQSHKHALELNKMNSFLSIERDNYEFMAKTDPLTSCFNRAGLRNIFSDIIIEYIETNMPASIVLFDIDHFKQINDNYGHDEGDKVLINIANLVRQQIREGDYLARWGGEEFLVVCTHTRQAGACALA
ncbi:GGDEF domain-containing protein, partial [Agarivorans sp.]|uniref:GGDEF domain-containing protein n=1 Tax=Agarivorans sp. TaxID=1872412 RepID=UPI003D041419